MIEKDYSKPDFPSYSDGFDNPNSPRTFSTELENTDTFNVNDIFNLGFYRTNPDKKVYFHKDKPSLLLEEVYGINFSVKDKVVRFISVYYFIFDGTSNNKIQLYYSSVPKKEEIEKIVNEYEGK